MIWDEFISLKKGDVVSDAFTNKTYKIVSMDKKIANADSVDSKERIVLNRNNYYNFILK